MKEKIRKEYYRRIRLVLKSELNAANRINAINTLAVPVVTYSFNIINWKMEELMKLDRKTRKFLTMAKMHHPKADVDRLYIPRKASVRGLVQLEITYKTTTIGLNTHLNNKDDYLLKIARDHDRGKKTMSIHHQAGKYGRELSLPEAEVVENEPATTYARRVKLKAKHQALEQLKSKWEEKPLHGQYPKRTKEKNVDQDKTHNWLSTPGLKSETEGFIIAAQDQCIKTNYYRNKILKDGTDLMCRICGKFQETVDHLVSGCPELAKTEYLQRHNKAAAYLHWTINIQTLYHQCTRWTLWTWTSYCDRKPNSDYTLGHANPNRQRDKSKQTRHSGEREEGKNLSAYRYVDPYREEHLLENNGKKILRLKSRKCGEWKQQLSSWSLELLGLSRREQKTTSARSQAILK